jgi:isoleucyl-tRNA synthetase
MRRIPEVLDCWFESGAMPYAQNHYPFENKELVEKNLPAEFIAEGLDQTRGWFYTLLVLSTALFDRPAFRNVIVNGLILAEDGQKMSKRLKNYPDPGLILETYGADALRAYLSTSPAVRAEPMRFAEAGVREVVRSVVLPLWNAYAFFATYASVDGWQPGMAIPVADRSLLDRWILSVVQSVVADVNTEMQAYRLYNVIPRVLGILDDLTNWYIRRSRRRFWKSDSDADKAAAFATLYEVLTLLSRLLAPILPFMAEQLYQRLEAGLDTGDAGQRSVHLQRFPDAQTDLQDEGLETRMALVRGVVRLGRNLREQAKVNVRQPLQTLTVALQDGSKDAQYSALADHPELTEIVADELNVKVVVVDADGPGHLVERQAKLNFKTAAKKLGGKTKEVAAALQALTSAEVATLQDQLQAGPVTVADTEVTVEDVEIRVLPKAGLTVATEGRLTVALDTTVTEPLRREGLARELVNRIQNLRKDNGLAVEERMSLTIATASDVLGLALAEHGAWVAQETLASSWQVVAAGPDAELVDVSGERVALLVARL